MAAELAKRILGGEQPPKSPAGEGGRDLAHLALQTPGGGVWLAALEDADTRAIIAAISEVGTVATMTTPTQIAYREAACSMVEQKVAERTIAEMRRLECIGVALAVVGIFVAVPSAVIAGLQLWEFFR